MLHAFKKKSKHGIGITKRDQALIAARLCEVVADRRRKARKGETL